MPRRHRRSDSPRTKKTPQPTTAFETPFWRRSLLVAGVDEVGRGCLAGPVLAAAVILPIGLELAAIDDSKALSPARRVELSRQLQEESVSIGLAFRDERHVEEYNIVQSSVHAMNEAIAALRPQPAHLLIDGNYFHGSSLPFTTIVKGDRRSVSIAAASIVAKVARDRWMVEVADKRWPEYGFARHKGYATRLHRDAIVRYGPCSLHRRTFLSKIFAEG